MKHLPITVLPELPHLYWIKLLVYSGTVVLPIYWGEVIYYRTADNIFPSSVLE